MPFERFGKIVLAEIAVRGECSEQIVIQRGETVEIEFVCRGILRACIGEIGLRAGQSVIPALIEDVDSISQRTFFRLKIPGLGFLFVAVGPVVVQTMSNALVNGGDGHHVGFSPLPTEIACLEFEQFQSVELHHRLFDAEGFAKDRSGFDGDEDHGSRVFAFGEFV